MMYFLLVSLSIISLCILNYLWVMEILRMREQNKVISDLSGKLTTLVKDLNLEVDNIHRDKLMKEPIRVSVD